MKNLCILIILIISLSYSKHAACQWVKIADLPNSNFTDLYFIDDSVGFTIGGEFVYKTTNGGYSWDSTKLGDALDNLYEFDFINQDTGFIVGEVSGARAFITQNQGLNWDTIGPYTFSSDIAIINSNEFLWCFGGYPGIWIYNVSLGLEMSLDPGVTPADLKVFSEDTIYVGGGGFSRSFDRGENWEIIEMPGILWMDFPTPRVEYAAADNYFKTIDYGETWVELELPYFFDGCTSPEVVSDSVAYFPCGYDDVFDYHGIMRTNDGGESWIFTGSDPPLFDNDAIGKIFCLNKDTCWCVTYAGQIYFTTNGGGETEAPVAIIENQETSFSVTPNPTSGRLNITSEKTINTLLVYDMFGNQVVNEVNVYQKDFKIDVSFLLSGLYIILINQQYSKFIKN